MNEKIKIFFKSSQWIAYISGMNGGLALLHLVLGNWFMFWWCLVFCLLGIPLWVNKIREE